METHQKKLLGRGFESRHLHFLKAAGKDSGGFFCFAGRINPESFIQGVTSIINQEKASMLINNITYSKTKDSYEDSIFTINNFQGSLQSNIMEVKKHVQNYLKYDSTNENTFARELEANDINLYSPNYRKASGYQHHWVVTILTGQ